MIVEAELNKTRFNKSANVFTLMLKKSICYQKFSKTNEDSKKWAKLTADFWKMEVWDWRKTSSSASSTTSPSSSTCPVDMFSQLILKILSHNWHSSLFPVCESTSKHPQTAMGRLHAANLASLSPILPARNQISPVKEPWLGEQWKSRGNLVLVRKHLKRVYRFSGLLLNGLFPTGE